MPITALDYRMKRVLCIAVHGYVQACALTARCLFCCSNITCQVHNTDIERVAVISMHNYI